MRWKYFVAAGLAAGVLVWFFSGMARDASTSAGQAAPAARPAAAPMASRFSGTSSASAPRRAPPPLPSRVIEHIASDYANSAVTREALTQIAYGWSQAIHDVHNPAEAKDAGNAIAKGIACALSQAVLAKSGVDQQAMLGRIKETRAVMLDTEADTQAYIRFQSLAGGQYFDDPGPRSCGFDPGSLQN
ncbi:hypothetical protein [Burkholderia glumae]|uniref:Uncharacterized protein n=1 Tax=Burkholderia glumae TaxID=337 RepID=A0AAQ0BRG3_BURGL|nr:hypothetical protein [Burkholderia glumae]AJY64517.1 putative lipoprotein [Burkholderia glumae LMG 2196 = ATCC 33617]KHJ62488.1 hypothetical protein NCPPB3923_13240 [Burkholderia glumae]MCM2485548.1 hypothetical protein [Burkholderia glumae]MCM2493718.1 hypothetical protein [Burkholderia glumae]MCM2511242.1 hypothetical protein [Burkholderia glumae]